MKIVIDTNVVISGTFFGGYPQSVLRAVVEGKIAAAATPEIVEEYTEITEEMISRAQGHIHREILSPFIGRLEMIVPRSNVHISRDPDDDKFISCALDANALYIVSGDKDLLVLEEYDGIEIITAKAFCEKFLSLSAN